jgi:hypothetical protein
MRAAKKIKAIIVDKLGDRRFSRLIDGSGVDYLGYYNVRFICLDPDKIDDIDQADLFVVLS